jgi:class 3 adenylate cyclase
MSIVAGAEGTQRVRVELARIAFAIGTVATIGTALASLPGWIDRSMISATQLAQRGPGFPYEPIAMGVLALGIGVAILFSGIGWLIFQARSGDVFGLVFAYNSVVIGFAVIGPWLIAPSSGLDQTVTRVVTSAAMVTILWGSFVFPDGRFVPPAMAWLLVIFATWQVGRAINPELGADRLAGGWFVLWVAFFWAAGLSQVFRYRAIATADQRAQMKWWLFGALGWGIAVAASLAMQYAFGQRTGSEPTFWFAGLAPLGFFPAVASALALYVGTAVFGLCVSVAILRYAALDIDVVISRTLVYAASTSLLVAALAGVAVLLSRLLGAGAGPGAELTSVLVLAAALGITFVPLRRLLESMADRLVAPRADLVLLFLDIVGSTERLAQVGDKEWADALGQFRVVVRGELGRHGGQEIDTAGDGFFATFASASAAVACACAVRRAVTEIGFNVRMGIHAGRCELRGRAPIGVTVHVAARLMGLASAGQIFVTEDVGAALGGGLLRLRDIGRRPLRGVPGDWHVLAVECEPVAPNLGLSP